MSRYDTPNIDLKSGISADEKEHLYKHVVWEGAQAAAVGAAAAGGATLLGNKFWPAFRQLRLPFKTFLILGITTGTFFTVADRASIRVSRMVAARRTHTGEAQVEDADHPVIKPIVGVREWLIKERYPLVFGLWSGTMTAALLYNFRRVDITRAQKIINSRMVAQTFALAGLGGIAALAATDPYEKQVDQSFERILHQAELHQKQEDAAKKH
ncbi:uncharacterized protein EV422DRAFT_311460 [Fimicolochytrium jonesii]|uniref:uncharacterized protein n=1 Tax=Fimicolochytrium jonesii TaxID=1396493 RepID=UPI0022FEC7A2|nr:uncharacterized protein EV422DRAFT_311460 [Fimicolochytrium jonesii]KAI8824212.1 hypothetical protein EV422DRAFT_311460 [Fimicolochytrium jonesii]